MKSKPGPPMALGNAAAARVRLIVWCKACGHQVEPDPAKPERPSHRDLWPFDQLNNRGIVATREHAERAGIQAGMYVLDIGCGLGGASRYLAVECSCRVAAIDLTANFVEAARILTARCGLAERIEFRQANALDLPFHDGTVDHVWSYAVTMNIADKEGLGREVARVLKSGGRFSCNEIARGSGEAPVFPLPWASDTATSFLATPAKCAPLLKQGACPYSSRSMSPQFATERLDGSRS
jgi:ubiquinone/menaquinone biosynthesis C-methylase UbiE